MNKVLAMNKKFLSLIVVVLMVFQTITSTAFAQSSTTEENTAATLIETTVAQLLSLFMKATTDWLI